jgi:hypothetical protein
MELTNVIEKLLNRDSFLNLLENDIIEKFKVSASPFESKILVVKMFLNTTKDELVGTEKLTPKLSEYELRDKLYKNYNLDPAWWQASIIPNKILKPLVGKDYFIKILIFVLDKNGVHVLTEN